MSTAKNQHNAFLQTDTLDEVLLDVATLIELSPRDRRVAENRYRLLKEHLERQNSPLAPYLLDGASLIYSQGSIATSTTIVSGLEDDRFDVDSIVEIDVPIDWPDSYPLDLLETALQGFPGAQKITRCTRCVQLQFPFMHMDVTILDRRRRTQIQRAGEIFHSPDKGPAYRVASNPWGFTEWFRSKVGPDQKNFAASLNKHREATTRNRLQFISEHERELVMKADQVDLPPMIPNTLDAQEAVALKLLKRFLNLRYEDLAQKRPPSIYLAKRAGDVGYMPGGLAQQLYALADSTAKIMRNHLAIGTRPQETNPSYPADHINDRWPSSTIDGMSDMRVFADQLEYLTAHLNKIAYASLPDIAKAIDDLFGELVGRDQRKVLEERYTRRESSSPVMSAPRTGAIKAPAVVVRTAELREVPRHNFHPARLEAILKTSPKGRRSPAAQLAAMRQLWPDFIGTKSSDGSMYWRGPLRPKACIYIITVFWNPKYMSLPYVVIEEPLLSPRPEGTFAEIPHLLFNEEEPTRSGLCLFDPDEHQWTPSDLIAETTIPWASEWLAYYELWHMTGRWLAPNVGYESVAQMRSANA